jgi:hypothetical protein
VRRPNFFILGAPKCGTTSLARWVGEHPSVFICPEKEPHFFNTDDRHRGVEAIEDYEALFSGAQEQHVAIGEASVWYLSSLEAVPNILRYEPAAKFIVLVRNPIEMAPALHVETVISGHESVRDFAKAWRLQGERRVGRHLPALTWGERRLLYGEVCCLGGQLKRLLSLVPAHRVLVIVLDDICANARREYLRVLDFLGVLDDGRSYFPAFNTARRLRWPRLTRAVFLLAQLRRRLGIRRGLHLWKRVQGVNILEDVRPALCPEIVAEMTQYFRADVQLLSELLQRDFQSWLL